MENILESCETLKKHLDWSQQNPMTHSCKEHTISWFHYRVFLCLSKITMTETWFKTTKVFHVIVSHAI